MTDIRRDEIKVTTDDGNPALKVRNALIRLTTIVEGDRIERVEVDNYDGPYFLLIDENDEVRGEISPSVDAKEPPEDDS